MQDTIGLDISKDHLDVFALSDMHHGRFANDSAGCLALARCVEELGGPLVVFEATGGYHRSVERRLAARGLRYCKVNPRQARRFIQAEGRLGKTDRADAASLARMGAAMALEPDNPLPEIFDDLRELLGARRALIKDRTAAATRVQTARHGLVRSQLKARLRRIARDLTAIDREIDAIVGADPELARRKAILESIPGISTVTAVALVIDMPELGRIDGKRAASLAGLAPVTRQSGRWRGKAFIGGGRKWLRHALYMPALAARRSNPSLRARADDFAGRGKPPKVILTAIMRKLIVLANALIRDNRTSAPTPP